MSYDQKIASARKIIDEHNNNADSQINFEDFTKKLKEMGGSSEDALKAASWEDLKDCGLPKIMARRLTYLFRQDGDGTDSKSTYISDKKASMLSPRELVQRYNPNDIKNPVGKRLKDLSDNKKFVVFHDNGSVNVDASVSLLNDTMNGLPEVDTAFVNGRPFPVYKVGDRFDAYAEENPLYPGRVLRSGPAQQETCDQTGRSWSGISTDIRQLLYLAVKQTKELEVRSTANAGDVMDRVMSSDCTLDSLRSRYPKASKMYDELVNIGRLPLLKIKLGGSSIKSNNPFGASEAKIW